MTRIALAGLLLIFAVPVSAGADALGCFTRSYDRAQLEPHPDQLVTAVKLRIHRPPPGISSKYWFLAQFRVRGRDDILRTSGICNEKASGLHCFVECDGGSVDVVPHVRDAMMYLNRIRVAACGEDYYDVPREELTGGKDDRVFRLDRVDAVACGLLDLITRPWWTSNRIGEWTNLSVLLKFIFGLCSLAALIGMVASLVLAVWWFL